MTTVYEVAALAGVSTATVSRVVHGSGLDELVLGDLDSDIEFIVGPVDMDDRGEVVERDGFVFADVMPQ